MTHGDTPSTAASGAPRGERLRERRRARTRDDIEAVALGLFLERGYDATTVEEIAEAALISPRTFFRYFSSKEDLLFARGREEMALAARSLAERPPDEPLMDSLRAVLGLFAELHSADRDRRLAWFRVVTTTPQLAAGFLEMIHGRELVLRNFVADRLGLDPGDRLPRLVAAAFGSAFRVAAETWHESDGADDLPALVLENVEALVAPLLAGATRPGGGSVT
jgi:AcrR family transcriptional regulator